MLDLLISGETSSVERIASVRSSSAVRLTFSVVMLVACFGAARGGFAETPASEARLRNGAHTVSPRLAESYGKVPLSFEPNQGQADGRVQFLSRGPGYGIFLTPGEAVLSFQGKDKAAGQSVLQMKLVGANAGAAVEAQDKLPGTSNYMKGTDQSKWAREVPTYGKVRYAGVYPGVDLVFYGNQRQLEYDFVVAPGSDAEKIALEFTGATPVVDAAGDLVLGAEGGAKFKRPVVYQMVGGERVAVAGAYEVRGQRVGFKLGKYDHSRELVIDPVVSYLTYLGGSSYNGINAIAVDSSGAAYLAGYTSSIDFPLKGAYESSFPTGATAMFVTKLNQSGTSIVYSTFLASNGSTQGNGIAVDSNGSAYVGGQTNSDGFPVTSGAFQTICGAQQDAQGNRVNGCNGTPTTASTDFGGVLAKLSPDGSSLSYATYLGGNNYNYVSAVALDSAGEAYVTGQTASYCGPGPYSTSTYQSFQCFPTTNGSPQSTTSTEGGSFAFFTKFDATGSSLIYSGILGPIASGGGTYGSAIAVDANGIGYITGASAGGTIYITDGALQNTGSANAYSPFVAKFDPSQQELIFSTYLGGQGAPQGANITDAGNGIAADANGNVYITGQTTACNFPTTAGAFQTQAQYAATDTVDVGKCNAGFVAKLNPAGSALTWATYLSGPALATGTTAQMYGLALGSDGTVYVAGAAQGSGYPQQNPALSQGNTNSVPVVTHLSADGSAALFSSTVGGPVSASEYAIALAVDSTGAIYLAGNTSEQYLPTTSGVVQPAFAGTPGTTQDGFIAKISPSTPPTPNNGLTGNLLANPGAELGSIADWTPGGNGTPQVDTGTFDPGINPHTGSYDFVGANGTADSLSQTVSILQQGITADQVDGGTLFANVSFWEQGLNKGTPSDSGGVTLTFLDTDGETLGTATIGPEDSHDGTWANVTGLPAIPVGTRSITYTMNFIRNAGNNNDSFIDDNVLSVHTNTGLTIFPSSLHFGNVPVGQLSQTQTATVTNNQTTAITIDQIISELGANPSEFGVSTYCPQGQSLAAGASCPVTITFAPTGVGPKSAGIAIQTESVPPLQQVLVDGNGTGGILQVNPGNLKAIAGNGTAGYSGDGGAALAAQLRQPNGVAFDPSGNLYIADSPANVIRKVDTAGNITTFAGDGTGGFNGDGGPATQAELYDPFSVTSDKNGNIYIQDTGNYVIRKVDATTGLITTVAGTPGAPGRLGDGGPATAAKLNENQGARFDSAGNLYVALCPTGTVRKIDTTGIITTVAGNPGTPGFSGDGGQATAAQLQCPSGVAIDAAGNFYIADEFNQVIRKVNTAGVISTIAGTPGVAGYGGDGGAATAAKFTNPNDVAIDSLGNLYVADSGNNRVRKIDTNGIITTAAGGLDNAGSAAVNTPLAVTVDAANHVYFSDSGNGKIQEIFPQGTQPFPATVVGSTSAAQSLTLSNIGNTDVTLAPDGAFNLSGDSSDFALTPGACGGGTVLAANGGSCALSITFAPTAVGQRTLTVMISDDALNSPQSFSIGGTGETPAGQTQVPVITWAMPAAITTASPLSATQLDATATNANGATIPGMFVYTPASGATLPAGTQTLSVTFTPNDIADYTTATGTTTVVVTQAALATTATTLAVTSGGSAAATVASGAVVTLTAAVVVGTAPVNPGQVAFCDATATTCTDSHLLGTAQLTSSGTATFRFVPGIGSHSYKAIFLGTNVDAGSGSAASALAVMGTYPTATTIAQSGVAGNYTLMATTVGTGSATLAPTGTVSFLDTSNANAVLGTGALGAGITGYNQMAAAGSPFSTVTNPFGGASGDFDGDGLLDLAVLGNIYGGQTQTLNILLGKGDGTFQLRASYSVHTGESAIQIADVNGDGVPDLVISESYTAVFIGNGDGTFQPEVDYPYTGSFDLGLADLNHDGLPDIVALYSASNQLYVQLNKGDGTFYPPVFYTTGNEPSGVAEVDFDGDGNIDLAVANYRDGRVSILRGNGDGTFQNQVTYAVGSGPYGIRAGDFNEDGFPDLAVVNSSDGTVGVLLSNGDGTFSPQTAFAVGTAPFEIAVADLNGDGHLDLTVSNEGSDTEGVLLGNGNGSFQTQITYAIGDASELLVVGDFNGDGHPDVAVAGVNTSATSILLSQVTQTTTATAMGVAPVGAGTHQVVASYPGDSNYNVSVSSPTGLTLTATAPVITWAMPAAITTATPLSGTQLDATAMDGNENAVAGTFLYAPAAGTYLAAGTQALSVTFTPTDTTNYTTATATTSIMVTQATMAPTAGVLAPITFGAEVIASSTALQTATVPFHGTVTLGSVNVLTSGAPNLDFQAAPSGGGSCQPGATYTAGQSCTVNAIFKPTAPGVRAGAIVVTAADQQLNFTGTAPDMTLYYGGPPYCFYSRSFTNTSMAFGIDLASATVVSGQVTFTNQESSLDGCPFGPFPVINNVYNLTSAVFDGAQLTATFTGVSSNDGLLNSTATFTGILSGRTITGTFNVNRNSAQGTDLYFQYFSTATLSSSNAPSVLPVKTLSTLYLSGLGNGAQAGFTPGLISTIAGSLTATVPGDGGPASAAKIAPYQLALDGLNNPYFPDPVTYTVRKISNGTIQSFAGNGTIGFSGDGGPAVAASIGVDISGIAVDGAGNLFLSESDNGDVRRIDGQSGIITTVAGSAHSYGFAGDGGPAVDASFASPGGIAVDASGNLYIADTFNGRIRMVDAVTHLISTVAGDGNTSGTAHGGDGGLATLADLPEPFTIALDSAGNIYIGDAGNCSIRKIDAATKIISLFAGNYTCGYLGDGGPATSAELDPAEQIGIDAAGSVYVADFDQGVIRKINGSTGVITTIAGQPNPSTDANGNEITPKPSSGDGGPATSAYLQETFGLALDPAGNLYATDFGVIREVTAGAAPLTFAALPAGQVSPAQAVLFGNTGNVPLLTNALNLPANFSQASGGGVPCTASTQLVSAAECNVSVAFSPVISGPITGNVTLEDNALASPQFIPVSGDAAALASTVSIAPPEASPYGSTVSLAATVVGQGTLPVTGSVTFLNGTATLGTALISAPGRTSTAVFTTSALPAGVSTITAVYSGDPAYNTSISAPVVVTITPFTPVLAWAVPGPITTATPLSATQLDAVATDINGAAVPGTFVYTPAAGTLLPVGTQTLSVVFTPTDTTDFTTATGTTTIVVTQASGGPATATITTLSVTSGGSAVTTVASGSVVTLTAAVVAGANSVSPAQVAFCDATATSCTGSHLLGIAQVTEAGTAIYKFVPGLGAHSYRAMFLGTKTYGASASTAAALAVTGTVPTTTTIAQNGTAGNYTLTGTVMGAPYPMQNATQSVTINLGQSAQIYVLTGTGGTAGNGGTYGNYYNTQGSCVTSGSTTTCDLTGPFTSSTAGYAAGTYDFQTVFTGPISSSVTSQTISPVGTNEPNLFDYSGFAPSTTMALKLNVTGGGAYTIPVVENGDFDPNLDDLSFDFTSTACGGTSLGSNPCQQDYVGTVAGATYSGPITGAVEFEMPSPPTLVGPTGTVSFLDTSNANASLGTGVLGAPTAGFSLAQAGPPLSLSQPFGGVSGDFNGDGLLDLAVLGNLSDQTQTLNIYLGNGDGTFTLHATYSVQTGAGVVQVADVNGDGIPDLVVPEANLSEGGSNAVFLGNGDGTFKPEVDYSAPEGFDLGLSDLNHDGLPDIVGLYPGGAQIYVQLNNGDGSFKAPVFYPSGNSPNGVAEADFDGDGNIDVAIANQSDGTVSVLLGKGDGTFQPQTTYAVGPAPASVRVGDFNEDGVVDLVVVNSGDGTIGILSGNGNGTFGAQKTYAVGSMPFQIAVADLNGDGHLDITISNSGSSTQGVVLGNGDGTFQTQVVYATAAPAALLGIGDFNGDGRPDVAVGTGVTSEITTLVSQVTETATATVAGVSPTAPGTHAVVASYPGDGHYGKSVSQATNLTTVTIAPVITWMPTVATIPYGTALGAQQLNATATSAGVAVPGTFVYTPAAGTVLTAGTQTLSVAFTPTSSSYSVATGTATITVTQATPVITWAAPAGIAYGTPLSATQLDATVAGVGTGALAGTLVYTPAAGTVLAPGMETLSVVFTPGDAVDYTTATASVPIVVGGLALSSFTPVGALIGSGDTTITLTGTGFVTTSMVMVNGAGVATAYVGPTMLTAVIPAALLKTTGALAVTVVDPAIGAATVAQTFSVVPPTGGATLSGPATTDPGSQPSVTLAITNPYPLALTAQFSLAFASAGTTVVDDPSIQFSSGGRTFSYTVAANSTSVPPVQLQAGTDAGTITITAKLMADGVDVTPAGLAPLVIVVPAVVPVISGTTMTASGSTLTVVMHGFSNTREVSSAVFDFTAATGDVLATPSVTIPATTIFGTWYGDPASVAYGSTFTYTQVFNTSADAKTIGSVKVTVTNSVGTSLPSTSTGP